MAGYYGKRSAALGLALVLAGCGSQVGQTELPDGAGYYEFEESQGEGLSSGMGADASSVTREENSSQPEKAQEKNGPGVAETGPETGSEVGQALAGAGQGSGEEPWVNTYTELEAGRIVRVRDLIESGNAEPVWPDKLVDTTSLGWHEEEILLRDGDRITSVTAGYNVSDTQAPAFLADGDGWEIRTGSAFDPWSFMSFGDRFDRAPTLEISGEVDTSQVGDYPVTATIRDLSGNASSRTVTIRVRDDADNSPYTGWDRIDFSDFAARYGGEGRSLGIDVSTWQGNVDYNAVKAAGCDFVIMRIGFCSNGGVTEDDSFQRNFQAAKDAGLRVGVYFYSSDGSESEVRDHAQWIIDRLGGEALDLPVGFDWENFDSFTYYGMSFGDLNREYLAFREELEKAGYETMLYSSRDFLYSVWETAGETVWLAHYAQETDYAGHYELWQRCGWGRIDGIAGDVDLDVMMENGQ